MHQQPQEKQRGDIKNIAKRLQKTKPIVNEKIPNPQIQRIVQISLIGAIRPKIDDIGENAQNQIGPNDFFQQCDIDDLRLLFPWF